LAIVYQGTDAPEATAAAGLLEEDRRDLGVLALTSPDRINAGWQAAERARQRGVVNAMSHDERLLAPLSRNCGLVTVLDGHPATLSWLGGVYGHRVKSLGVEHFGQTGSIEDLYRHYGIDANAIAHAGQAVSAGRPVRHLAALP
jgi:pyruvate dehydrogenase E1 component